MARSSSRLLRRGFDDLGLRAALSDRVLPLLVGAMAFLAALAGAGAGAASQLAQHWQSGAGAALTVQVPQPADPVAGPGSTAENRLDVAIRILRGTPGIAAAHALDEAEMNDLLRPWLGEATGRVALPLPGVIELRLSDPTSLPPGLAAHLAQAVPGSSLESNGIWAARLARLAISLQACAGLAVLLVAGIAAAVIAVATRAGLLARRDAIAIVHGLGATDFYIAARFAGRVTLLAGLGAILGAALALPVLLALARLAAPFAGWMAGDDAASLPPLPASLWLMLLALPVAAAAIGWLTAQATVHRWLRHLP